jgi:hypothetical protein
VRYLYEAWPPHGLMLDDETFGAASSWTREGYPPAGGRCSLPPPGVTVHPDDVTSEK